VSSSHSQVFVVDLASLKSLKDDKSSSGEKEM